MPHRRRQPLRWLECVLWVRINMLAFRDARGAGVGGPFRACGFVRFCGIGVVAASMWQEPGEAVSAAY
jgi:hypothetical protein